MKVKDILSFGGLRDGKVVAGKDGLNNEVRSVTVLEVAEEIVRNWVLEYQLCITSFYAIVNNVEMQKKIILALHESNASGLVICHIDIFLKNVDPEIIKLCDKLNFPLIIANSNTSYIEILNPIIVKLTGYSNLEYDSILKLQNNLIEHIATKNDIEYIFKTMSEEYGDKIFFLDINNVIVYPKYSKENEMIINLLKDNIMCIKEECDKLGYCMMNNYIIYPIICKKMFFGTIVCMRKNNITIDNNLHIIKSMANLCTLLYSKKARVEEMEIARKEEYISDLLIWNFRSDKAAIIRGKNVGWDIINKVKMVIINFNDIQKTVVSTGNRAITELLKYISTILYDKIKYYVINDNSSNIIGLRSDMCIILLHNCDHNNDINKRAKTLANNILKYCIDSHSISVSIGISGNIDHYKDIPKAYTQALDAAVMGRYFLGENRVMCYDDIPSCSIFRLIDSNIFYAISNNIRSILDQNANDNLYETLKVLISNNMNTKKAAERLHIHYNTVNYRKNKIVEILGYKPWDMPYLVNAIIAITADILRESSENETPHLSSYTI